MGLLSSLAPDITESIPSTISARREIAASYNRSGIRYDVAIGGLPFLIWASDSHPYQRQTADLRKQQIDTSKEAGEQTLDQWWTRSQTSWHRGEGINFYEPGSDPLTEYRYAHAVGVDVWTKGQVTLLHSTSHVGTVGAGQNAFCATGGSGAYFTVENTALKRRGASPVTYTGATPATPPVLAGSSVLVGAADGIYSGSTTGSTLTKLYTTTAVLRPWWVKSRIIAADGADLYELPLAVVTPPGSIGAAFYTHPDAGWTWTAVSDSPGAILAAGYSDGHSVIYRFALEDAGSGSTPKLGQAYQVAEFPPEETVHSLHVYLGTYLGIGTSKGVRIGIVDGNGNIQYGPLIVETDEPVYDLAARDSFVYAAVTDAIDGKSGAVRINLAEEVEPLRFAYAWDAQTHVTGDCVGVAFVGGTDRVVLAVSGDGIYEQSATAYEADGYVTSGRIRYGTTESKSFQRVRVNAHATAAGSGVTVLFRDENDSERSVYRISNLAGFAGDATLSTTQAMSHASFRLRLEASTDGLSTAQLDALLVKALPYVRRQRLYQFPLTCFDSEADRKGARFTSDGGAAMRLLALEEMESTSATVQVQDFASGESFEGQIEQIAFTRTSSDTFGGLLVVTVRKV